MELEIKLHGRRAVLLRTGYGSGTPPDEFVLTELASRLSAQWFGTRGPRPDELNRWLDNLRPEQGASTWYRRQADERLAAIGMGREVRDAADQIWAHAQGEFPGAVTFAAWDQGKTQHIEKPGESRRLNELEIGRMLVNAQQIWTRAREEWPGKQSETFYSSGMRGKFGVRIAGSDGVWEIPPPGELTTHIVKHEDRAELLSEAAAEATCQRALSNAGVRAAITVARVFEGVQALVSTRTDRTRDEAGTIRAIHQEEWLQALGRAPGERHGWNREQGWEELARLLACHGKNPERERRELVRMLAGAVILNHTDLHRRNIGLMHTGPEEPAKVEVAPFYDVSSGDGRGAVWRNEMSIAIEAEQGSDRINERIWRAFARRLEMDEAEVLDAVSDVAEAMPDAFAQARHDTLKEDELKHRGESMRRLEAIQAGVQRRAWANRTARAR